jgi:hypothetical protein
MPTSSSSVFKAKFPSCARRSERQAETRTDAEYFEHQHISSLVRADIARIYCSNDINQLGERLHGECRPRFKTKAVQKALGCSVKTFVSCSSMA